MKRDLLKEYEVDAMISCEADLREAVSWACGCLVSSVDCTALSVIDAEGSSGAGTLGAGLSVTYNPFNSEWGNMFSVSGDILVTRSPNWILSILAANCIDVFT